MLPAVAACWLLVAVVQFTFAAAVAAAVEAKFNATF